MTQAEEFAATLRGRRVSRVRRILYEVGGSFRSDVGPLELTLVDGGPFVLQPASDGETLSVRSGPWTDPFAPPLSPENEEFVRTHGKWTAIDVSSQNPFSALVGARVELVSPVLSPDGAVVGIEATFDRAVLRVEVEADELVLDVVVSRAD